MSGPPGALLVPFLSTFPGDGGGLAPDLEPLLWECWQRGAEAWPGVDLDAMAFAAYLGARAPAAQSPVDWLRRSVVSDMFLACACLERVPGAMESFRKAFVARVGDYLRTMSPSAELAEDTAQQLLEKIFVGVRGGPPRIAQYSGQGSLGGWVRIAAVRTALHLTDSDRAARPRPDEVTSIAEAVVPVDDPELDLMRRTYHREFLAAFRAAIAELPRRDRAVLRMALVEQMTPGQVAAMYRCHRTTAMRWISAAAEALLATTRRLLMEQLRASESECDGIFALVRSRLDLTLDALFQSTD